MSKKGIILTIVILVAFFLCLYAALKPHYQDKVTLKDYKNVWVVDGYHSGAYNHAADSLFQNGMKKTSPNLCRWTAERAGDFKTIVLINPTSENVLDFLQIAKQTGTNLIIGSLTKDSDQKEIKSDLFDQGVSKKDVQFITTIDWSPDNFENLNKRFSY